MLWRPRSRNTEFGRSYAEDFEAFAQELTGAEPVESESGGFSIVPVLIVGGIVGLVGYAVWRGSRKAKEAGANLLEEARTEIRQQMDVIASQIVDLADNPRVEVEPRNPDSLPTGIGDLPGGGGPARRRQPTCRRWRIFPTTSTGPDGNSRRRRLLINGKTPAARTASRKRRSRASSTRPMVPGANRRRSRRKQGTRR